MPDPVWTDKQNSYKFHTQAFQSLKQANIIRVTSGLSVNAKFREAPGLATSRGNWRITAEKCSR